MLIRGSVLRSALKIVADQGDGLRGIPFRRRRDAPHPPAAPVEQDACWQGSQFQRPHRRRIPIENNLEIADVEPLEERTRLFRAALVDTDGKHSEFLCRETRLQRSKRWHFTQARRAPGSPEIDENYPSLKVAEVHRAARCIEKRRRRHWQGHLIDGKLRHPAIAGRGVETPIERKHRDARHGGAKCDNADRPENPNPAPTHCPQPVNAMTKNSMWGGRFATGPEEAMTNINASIEVDQRLHAQDIAGSKAHCRMLVAQGIISAADSEMILAGLDAVAKDIDNGTCAFSAALEDIHMNIEAALAEHAGDAAGRLHTARSRNDQVATDLRLWLRDAIDAIDEQLRALQAALLDQAEAHAATVMPGYTHLQTAQPVTFGHHLLAYVEMAGRDRGRLADCRRRLNESPLGAGALAGTAFPVDRDATAVELGFDRPMANSMDAVSARDFALEFLAAAGIAALHLSRLAEEIVLWSSPSFAFIRLSDAFSTGSSMMPQKRNPDAAELIRAKSGRILGAFVTLAAVMKGLPLTYAKDLQEDKEPVFDAADNLALGTMAMAGMVADMTPDPEAMRRALDHGHPTATDLADWLVRTLDIPFRQAHHVTGVIVAKAEEVECRLDELPLEAMQAVEAGITAEIFTVLSPEASVASRTSLGGTAPENVRAAVQAARERFLQ